MSQPKTPGKQKRRQSATSRLKSSPDTQLLPLEGGLDTTPTGDESAASTTIERLAQMRESVGRVVQSGRSVLDIAKRNELLNARLPEELERLKNEMQRLLASGALDAVHESCSAKLDAALRDAPVALQQLCSERGFEVRGEFADFIINGTVYVGVDEKRLRAIVNDAQYDLFPLDALIGRVAETVSTFANDEFDAREYLEELWKAYRLCSSSRNPTTDLIGGLVCNFRKQHKLRSGGKRSGVRRNPVHGALRR